MNYYNEICPKDAAWLRELIADGLIPNGHVDERSILDVRPHEITSFTQHHFFAGVGGWPLALRLAGWPEDRPVRTGSCPCQPFSIAGHGLAEEDDRHLWPSFRDILTFLEPAITFGEQVASPDGREWLAGVRADLEGLGYEVGATDLCAAGIAAPHPRQRLYWVANPQGKQSHGSRNTRRGRRESSIGGHARGVVLPDSAERQPGRQGAEAAGCWHSTEPAGSDVAGGLELAPGIGRRGTRLQDGRESEVAGAGEAGGLEHSAGDGREQWWSESSGRGIVERCGWSNFGILPFRDGKLRRVEAGTFPLAPRLPRRMVPLGPPSIQEAQDSGEEAIARLKGYGNAIVPLLAAQFIRAAIEAITHPSGD